MFGKKKEEQEVKKPILVVTMDDIPGRRYEAIQLLTGEVTKAASGNFAYVTSVLMEKARAIDADAIVGFRAIAYTNSVNWVTQSAYGTAVKFIDVDEA